MGREKDVDEKESSNSRVALASCDDGDDGAPSNELRVLKRIKDNHGNKIIMRKEYLDTKNFLVIYKYIIASNNKLLDFCLLEPYFSINLTN